MISPTTILLLDDEPLMRGATALILARKGAEVTAVATADEAVAYARERVYDVAVFDVSPPSPGAAEVLRRIRERGLAPRRVIAVTNAPVDGGDESGLTVVLPKPYPFDRLLHAVFGAAHADGRRRTRSGVFRAIPSFVTRAQGPRAAARAGRGRGG
jgi:CheY-like chemotaxis protein